MSFKLVNMRRAVLSVAVTSALAGISSPVIAQDDDTTELDRLEVTGTRIRQAQVEGAQPILTLDRADIQRTGLTSTGDLLQRLTESGSAINTRFNSSGNFGFPPDGGGIGAGATQVDMRHLGPKRVLVLVDGIRWVAGSSASGVASAVDLNTIPIGIIDRVEVLKDGASSIYGSDAIAGVINIITRKDFEGLEADAFYGVYDEGDGDNTQFNITFGGTGDRHSIMFNLGYIEQEEVSAADRKLSRFPVPGTGVTRGSSGTPQGRFLFNDPNTGEFLNLTINNGVTGIPFYDPTSPGAGDDFHPFTNDDRFNFSPFNLYQTPSERINAFAQGTFDITDDITFYAKAMYNNRQSVNQAAPEPIFIGPDAGTGGLGDTIVVDSTNPFNPFGFDVFADGFGFIGRRPIELGPRVFRQDVDTFYTATGFRGEFEAADRLFFWDINYAYGNNQANQIKTGALNIARIATALGPLDECQSTPGCVPFNIFGGQGSGGGTITQEMLDYVTFIQKDESENELRDLTANISGEIFELPAGPLSFALGYEHREQEGFFQPDAVVVAGESNGVPAQPTSGKFDVDAYYGEVNIPILADVAGAQLLDVTLAVRTSDYSTSGSETTGKAGFRWAVNDELLVRGTFAEGLRAPTIGELFGSQARFDAVLNDPCSTFLVSGLPQDQVNNCIAQGVPSDGSYQQSNPQISTLTGGNPDLLPETSDTLTFGVVYSPLWAEGLSWSDRLDFELTYYDIELEGAIQAPDAQTILNQCVATNDPSVCSAITRNQNGVISSFQNTLTNIGAIETSGWDFNIGWTAPETDWGQFRVQWNNTIVDDYVEFNPVDTGLVATDLVGIEVNDSAIPEWQSNLEVVWLFSDWEVSGRLRHIDSVTESCSDFLDGSPHSLTNLGLCSNPNTTDNSLSTNELDSTTYFDLQVVFPEFAGIKFEAGVNNLFDEDPPVCLSCSLNGYDPSTYDPEGQFGYVRASIDF